MHVHCGEGRWRCTMCGCVSVLAPLGSTNAWWRLLACLWHAGNAQQQCGCTGCVCSCWPLFPMALPQSVQVLSARLPGGPGLLGTHARALEAFARLVPARPELLPRIIQKVPAGHAHVASHSLNQRCRGLRQALARLVQGGPKIFPFFRKCSSVALPIRCKIATAVVQRCGQVVAWSWQCVVLPLSAVHAIVSGVWSPRPCLSQSCAAMTCWSVPALPEYLLREHGSRAPARATRRSTCSTRCRWRATRTRRRPHARRPAGRSASTRA